MPISTVPYGPMRFWLRVRFLGAASASPAQARLNTTTTIKGIFFILVRSLFEDFRQEFFQRVPGTSVGILVILHASRARVRHGVGECVHGLAVGMQLPVCARGGELLRDREDVGRRGHGIVVP